MKVYPRETLNFASRDITHALCSLIASPVDRGEDVRIFEQQFARRMGCDHGIAVSSGRFALALILQKGGLQPGDEVILPSFTYHAVPRILVAMKLKPVFVDSRESDFTIDPALVEQSITSRTKAIIPTHLYGQPAEMDAIIDIAEQHDLLVIEDCAQAMGATYHGRTVGSLGDAAMFSLAIAKNLGGFGGGIITTNDSELAEMLSAEVSSFPSRTRLSLLRSVFVSSMYWFLSHPTAFKYTTYPLIYASRYMGIDAIDLILDSIRRRPKNRGGVPRSMLKRFPDLNARILSHRLQSLDRETDGRIALAEAYNAVFEHIPGISIARLDPQNHNTYTAYGVRVPCQDPGQLQKILIRKGIDTRMKYMSACSELPPFQDSRVDCPVARRLTEELVHLPLAPHMDEEDARHIAETLRMAIIGEEKQS